MAAPGPTAVRPVSAPVDGKLPITNRRPFGRSYSNTETTIAVIARNNVNSLRYACAAISGSTPKRQIAAEPIAVEIMPGARHLRDGRFPPLPRPRPLPAPVQRAPPSRA